MRRFLLWAVTITLLAGDIFVGIVLRTLRTMRPAAAVNGLRPR